MVIEGERSDCEAGNGSGGGKTREMNFVKSSNCCSWIEHDVWEEEKRISSKSNNCRSWIEHVTQP